MKRLLVVAGLALVVGWFLRAQTLSAPAHGVTAAQTLATCAAPTVGMTWYCEPFSGPAVSINGAAYVSIPLSIPAIPANVITGITVNGTAQPGPVVALTIPSKVSINSTGTLQ